MAPTLIAPETHLDLEAKRLLADGQLGVLIAMACGAAVCSRRDRQRSLRALDALIARAQREPAIADVLVRSVAACWRQRLAQPVLPR